MRRLDWLNANGARAAFGFGDSLVGSVLIQLLADGADFRAVVAESPYSSFEAVADERVVQLWLFSGAKHTGVYAAGPREFERRVLQWFARHNLSIPG